MDERVKRDTIMFLAVLIACLIFVAAVETFTGILSETRERNLSNKQTIGSIFDILGAKGDYLVKQKQVFLGFYDNFLFEEFF